MHTYAYSCFYAYLLLCIFIAMHIHCNAYSCNAYSFRNEYACSFLCIFVSMHIHCYTYSSLCIFTPWHRPVYISYCPSHSTDGQTQTENAHKKTDTYRYTHIQLQKIPQDRIPIIRDYRLSGWFYNANSCRCYLSHRQAVLYEATLGQLQVGL